MKISSSNMAYIWFGAALSIAEIMTGTYFAGLDYSLAIAAIVLGHLIGGIFLFAAGLIGAKEKCHADCYEIFWQIWFLYFYYFKYYPAHRLDLHHDLRWVLSS